MAVEASILQNERDTNRRESRCCILASHAFYILYQDRTSMIGKNDSKCTIRFSTVFKNPFERWYNVGSFSLNTELLTSKCSEYIRSFETKYLGETGEYGIKTESKFEIESSLKDCKIIFERSVSELVINDNKLFRSIANEHRNLSHNILKYIGWKNNFYIDNITKKEKESRAFLESGEVERSIPVMRSCFVTNIYDVTKKNSTGYPETDIAHFYKLHNSGLGIPIHQEILTEVVSLFDSNNTRSAYLLLYSALEVSTKNFIKAVKPDTEYLVDKMQAPELSALHSKYINVHIFALADTKEIKAIKKMTERRNGIAHRGENIDWKELKENFILVKELIKRMENFAGCF